MPDSKNKLYLFSGLVIVITLIAIVSFFSDSNSYILLDGGYEDVNQVAQYHREAGIDTTTINTWQNVSFDVVVDKEITNGYSLVDNNQSVQVDFDGIVKLQGKVTLVNNATSSEVQKIALRIVSNGNENRCTQVSSTTNRGSGNFNTVPITGTTNVTVGDKIQLQYQVDNTNLDMWGDPIFDVPVAISLNFEKISG